MSSLLVVCGFEYPDGADRWVRAEMVGIGFNDKQRDPVFLEEAETII